MDTAFGSLAGFVELCTLSMFLSLLHSKLLFLFLAKLSSCLTDHPLAPIFLHGDKDPEPMERLHKHECENKRVLDEVERVQVAFESSQCRCSGVVTSREVDEAGAGKQHKETER